MPHTLHLKCPTWNRMNGASGTLECPKENRIIQCFRCAALILLYGTDGCILTELDSFSNMTTRSQR